MHEPAPGGCSNSVRKVDIRLPGKGKLPGPPNHLDDTVDSDQKVVNKELSLSLVRVAKQRKVEQEVHEPASGGCSKSVNFI